ncbi:MAG: pilus assembly protein PilP [Polyangiaceae bacterium]
MNVRSIGSIVALAALLGACGDAPPTQPTSQEANPNGANAPPPPIPQTPAAPGAKSQAEAMPSNLPPLPVRDIQERDFTESPTNRDPFRSYADSFRAVAAVKKVTENKDALIGKYSIDELKIVGIVTGGMGRVLIDDPSGLGWVIKVGDYVGKPEVVHGTTSGNDVSVNWRVDRIRPNDVVFVREDPSRPDVPPTTRVLSMRTEEEMEPQIHTGTRGTPSSQPIELPPTPNGPPPKGS